MTINCIIIDDEPFARKVIREYIEQVDFLTLVGEAENPMQLPALLDEHKVDLLFLDIQMPKMSGLKLLHISNNLPLTIITTAYPEHALEGFELDILDYLVKPISIERFVKACNKAKQYIKMANRAEEDNSNYFFVKCNNKIEKIDYDDLLYIESMVNYVTLHTRNGKLVSYITLKSVLDHLPVSKFIKVHKSFAVNISKIQSIDAVGINIGKAVIPVSQNLRAEVMEIILGNKMVKR